MPYSSNLFDETVKAKIAYWDYQRYLDVGCGAGKYGRMIRTLQPEGHITGVEVDSEYIDKFDLRSVYDVVINDSVVSLVNGPQSQTYDVVIFGDVIEHLRKSDGLD